MSVCLFSGAMCKLGGFWCKRQITLLFCFSLARWAKWWQGIATALRCSLMTAAATQSYKWVHLMHSVSTQMNAQSWSHWKCIVVCGGMVWVDLLMRWQWQRSAVAGYRRALSATFALLLYYHIAKGNICTMRWSTILCAILLLLMLSFWITSEESPLLLPPIIISIHYQPIQYCTVTLKLNMS